MVLAGIYSYVEDTQLPSQQPSLMDPLNLLNWRHLLDSTSDTHTDIQTTLYEKVLEASSPSAPVCFKTMDGHLFLKGDRGR